MLHISYFPQEHFLHSWETWNSIFR